jgi:hypothetical protein
VEDIARDNTLISSFIKEQLSEIVKKGLLKEVLMAHIHPIMSDERIPIVDKKISKILNL